MMRYPDFKIMEKMDVQSETEAIQKMVTNCIDYIYDEETLYYAKDVSETELVDFVDSLTRDCIPLSPSDLPEDDLFNAEYPLPNIF